LSATPNAKDLRWNKPFHRSSRPSGADNSSLPTATPTPAFAATGDAAI
jgi:hypothetical protein